MAQHPYQFLTNWLAVSEVEMGETPPTTQTHTNKHNGILHFGTELCEYVKTDQNAVLEESICGARSPEQFQKYNLFVNSGVLVNLVPPRPPTLSQLFDIRIHKCGLRVRTLRIIWLSYGLKLPSLALRNASRTYLTHASPTFPQTYLTHAFPTFPPTYLTHAFPTFPQTYLTHASPTFPQLT